MRYSRDHSQERRVIDLAACHLLTFSGKLEPLADNGVIPSETYLTRLEPQAPGTELGG